MHGISWTKSIDKKIKQRQSLHGCHLLEESEKIKKKLAFIQSFELEYKRNFLLSKNAVRILFTAVKLQLTKVPQEWRI